MEESHQDEDHEAGIGKNPCHSARTFQQKSFGNAIRQFPEA
jgi:hypothetical protein